MPLEDCEVKKLLASGEIGGTVGDISYQVVTLDNVEKLVDFFFTSYFKDEPILTSTGTKPDNPKVRKYLSELICPHENKGCALMAVDSKNNYKVVGYIIGYTSIKADRLPKSRLQQMCSEYPETWAHIIPMMDAILNYEEIYNIFPDIEKVQSFFGHGTGEKYQGRGIGTNLLVRSINLAKSAGVPVMQCIASSLCTTRICEKLGFDTIKEYSFEQFHRKKSFVLPGEETKQSWDTITCHTLRIN